MDWGSGENSELGLGPKKTGASRPAKDYLLDAENPSAFHVARIACGAMHTIAIMVDNKIITWGVNDEKALGRNTQWESKTRDIDASSDDEDEDGELNPLE